MSRLDPAAVVTTWRAFIGRSPLRELGSNALVAVATSTFAKGLGFIKEILVAAFFGLSGALDIYLMAVVLIGFPVSILVNAIQTTLIRTVAVGQARPAGADRLFAATTLVTVTCLLVLLPFWLVLLNQIMPWLASGFPPEKQQEMASALCWLVPYYFVNGISLLGYGVLQARGRFLTNGLLPSLTPIVTIAILIAFDPAGDWRILTTALVVGIVLECLALLVILRRCNQLARPSRQDLRGTKAVLSAGMLLLPGTLMMAIGPVVEQAIAASMSEGTNAALGYGLKLPAALQGILLTAIGITALPFFAGQLGQNRAAYCLHSLDKLYLWLLAGGAILVVPLIAFSPEIVKLLYERGAFDAAATSRVAPIQLAYFVQLPFAIVAMVGLKALAALGREGLMSTYIAIGVALQCVLAYVLGLRYGAAGIAWAASAVSALLAGAYFVTARAAFRRLSE